MQLQAYIATFNMPVFVTYLATSTDQAKELADAQCAVMPPGSQVRCVYRSDCVPPPDAPTPAPHAPQPSGRGPRPKGGGTPTAGRMVKPEFTQVVAA